MNTEQTGGLDRRVATYAALADPTRLRIVDLLSVNDLAPTELAAALDTPSNLLAHHLKVLEQADLIGRRRSEGDRRRAYLSLKPLPHAVLTTPLPATSTASVVFVCTANTARSHLAAALWRKASTIPATSAGTHPGTEINPLARAAARRHGTSLPNIKPRLLDPSRRLDDELVITVCDRAHEELGGQGWAHWSVPDPVTQGTDKAFDAALQQLAGKIDVLAPQLGRAS